MTRSDKNGAGKREAGGQRSFGPPGNGADPKPPATFVIVGHIYIYGRECLETMTRHPGPNHPMLHAYLPLLFGWRYLVFVRRCRQAKFPQPYVRVFLLPLAPINPSPFHAMRGVRDSPMTTSGECTRWCSVMSCVSPLVRWMAAVCCTRADARGAENVRCTVSGRIETT